MDPIQPVPRLSKAGGQGDALSAAQVGQILRPEELLVLDGKNIADVGEKLGGARKDYAQSSATDADGSPIGGGGQATVARSGNLLDTLWPKPPNWTDLIGPLGVRRAALCMVMRGNVAKNPHRHAWHDVPGELWEKGYEFGIYALRRLLEVPGPLELSQLIQAFEDELAVFDKSVPPSPGDRPRWRYAIGRISGKKIKHPMSLSPVDDLRWKYLGHWGWGMNPLVDDKFSMGALSLSDKKTGEKFWRAVQGTSGAWEYLEQTKFGSESEALVCAETYVQKALDERALKAATEEAEREAANPVAWKRPISASVHYRAGFSSADSTDKSEIDLLTTFGFRGIEFGNWVTQTERREFVNATYDALQDLVDLLGVPPLFVSLDGLLGLGYGSRGHGLSNVVAHFEVSNWILHLTKNQGFGALAHELGHALDAWAADCLWGEARANHLRREAEEALHYLGGKPFNGNAVVMDSLSTPEMASEQTRWTALDPQTAQSKLGKAMVRWIDQVDRKLNASDARAQKALGRAAWQWLQTSQTMDAKRKPYWSTSAELFARSFEVMIHDSLERKGRANHMLVYGCGQDDGLQVVRDGRPYPYPMGDERLEVCKEIAGVIRAIKTEFLHLRQLHALTVIPSNQQLDLNPHANNAPQL